MMRKLIDVPLRRETGRVPDWTIAAALPRNDETGVCLQHAVDVADAISARLTLLDPAQSHPFAAHADLLLVVTRRTRGWNLVRRAAVPARLLRSTHRPVWLTDADALRSGAPFRCRRILCVVTLQPADEPVLRHAQSLASRTGAELALLHVLPPPPSGLLWWRVSLDRPTQASVARERLLELEAETGATSGSIVTTGSAANSIGSVAAESSADVVVLPWTGAAHASAIIRQLACPLALVPVS